MAEPRVPLTLQARAQLAHDARFADPGFAREQHHLPFATLRQLPAVKQQAELVLAPDQRGQAGRVHRLEAALGGADADHPPGPDWLGEALEMLRAEVGQLEQLAYEPPRPLADDDAAGLGDHLQAGREVGRLADHGLLLRGAVADQLTYHDRARGDADPGCQRFARRRFQVHQRIADREPGAHGTLRLVLVGPRPAEIGQHAIAHVFGDVSFETRDLARHRVLIGADQRAHVFRVEARHQLGRAHQVTKQDCQLSPLRVAGNGSRRRHGVHCNRSSLS